MLLWIFKTVKGVRAAVLGSDTARQLAWGIALGILLGLVPKGNLLAPLIAMLICALTVSHAVALATATVVTLCGWLLDPWSHEIGLALLSNPSVRGVLTNLQRYPLVPWLALNNTVVLGSFVLGVGLTFPVYRLALPLMQWLKARHLPPTTPPPAAQGELRFDGAATQLETHIDVIRISRKKAPAAPQHEAATTANANHAPGDANEALRYLVRHVRDSREEKAA